MSETLNALDQFLQDDFTSYVSRKPKSATYQTFIEPPAENLDESHQLKSAQPTTLHTRRGRTLTDRMTEPVKLSSTSVPRSASQTSVTQPQQFTIVEENILENKDVASSIIQQYLAVQNPSRRSRTRQPLSQTSTSRDPISSAYEKTTLSQLIPYSLIDLQQNEGTVNSLTETLPSDSTIQTRDKLISYLQIDPIHESSQIQKSSPRANEIGQPMAGVDMPRQQKIVLGEDFSYERMIERLRSEQRLVYDSMVKHLEAQHKQDIDLLKMKSDKEISTLMKANEYLNNTNATQNTELQDQKTQILKLEQELMLIKQAQTDDEGLQKRIDDSVSQIKEQLMVNCGKLMNARLAQVNNNWQQRLNEAKNEITNLRSSLSVAEKLQILLKTGKPDHQPMNEKQSNDQGSPPGNVDRSAKSDKISEEIKEIVLKLQTKERSLQAREEWIRLQQRDLLQKLSQTEQKQKSIDHQAINFPSSQERKQEWEQDLRYTMLNTTVRQDDIQKLLLNEKVADLSRQIANLQQYASQLKHQQQDWQGQIEKLWKENTQLKGVFQSCSERFLASDDVQRKLVHSLENEMQKCKKYENLCNQLQSRIDSLMNASTIKEHSNPQVSEILEKCPDEIGDPFPVLKARMLASRSDAIKKAYEISFQTQTSLKMAEFEAQRQEYRSNMPKYLNSYTSNQKNSLNEIKNYFSLNGNMDFLQLRFEAESLARRQEGQDDYLYKLGDSNTLTSSNETTIPARR